MPYTVWDMLLDLRDTYSSRISRRVRISSFTLLNFAFIIHRKNGFRGICRILPADSNFSIPTINTFNNRFEITVPLTLLENKQDLAYDANNMGYIIFVNKKTISDINKQFVAKIKLTKVSELDMLHIICRIYINFNVLRLQN